MDAQKFQFCGVMVAPEIVGRVHSDGGAVAIAFNVLVNRLDEEGDPLGEPFSVGRVKVRRYSDYALSQAGYDRIESMDMDAETYEWGVFTHESYGAMWDKAFKQSFTLEMIHDFVAIESAFIDPQFRSNGLFGHALVAICSVIGVSSDTAIMLLANPWAHLEEEGSLKDPAYKNDMKKLVNAYKKIGFKTLCRYDEIVVMALLTCFRNKRWDALWEEGNDPEIIVSNFSGAAIAN